MKALEKDRNRRYKTADAFAADVGRHLANEPVEARPPTVAYRMAKFVRRNRAAVVVVSLTCALLCAGLTFYRREAQVQQQLRDAAIAAEQAALQREKEANEILAELQDEQKLRATTLAMSGRRAEATRVARQLVRDPSQRAWEPFIVGHLEFFDGNIEEAFQRFAEACRSDREFLAARMMLALTYLYRGLAEPYREELEEANKMSADGLVNELYAIQANMYDRSQTLETIDKIEQFLAEQPYSPVARLVRAEVMLHKGLQYSDMNAIDQAIHDSRIALEEIPGNPMATFLKMTAHGFAVRLCRQKGWTDEIPEHIREGEAAARQLEPLNWAAGHRYRALFYGNCALGFAKEAQAWEQAQKCGLRGFLMDDYLTFHFQYGTTPTVDRELDPSTEPYAVLAECLLSASDPQMRRDSIRRIRTKLISPGEPVDFYVAAVLALLGHDVHAYASQGFGFTNHRASVPKETSLVLNEYFRGRINEKQMIEACASQGIVETGFVRLCAGLRLIGERKVERAMQLLDKVASESGDQWSSIHANAILTRLREARDWPYLGDDVREPTIDRKATSR